jgi:hypothetical protein
MTKLCPRGKAAAKRKFKVYPSAYANAYASRICAGKIKDPSGVKRKDFRGSKAEGGRIGYKDGTELKKNVFLQGGESLKRLSMDKEQKKKDKEKTRKQLKELGILRKSKAEGGLMEATARLRKQGLRGGGMSSRGLGRAFMKGGRV